ncbi:DUF2061 domain-containing protein [Fontibacter flavus]|uniref:DUF2061 domain-containing protein n=1 Tax=Fontibacter flavus TaxID=654838 RepID=A0ABV6FU65_9BACT
MILDQPIKRWFITKQGKDSNVKSLMKSISWRVVGTLDTMVISFLVTGQLVMAVSIGSIEVVTKIALYYLHERAWESATKIDKDEPKKEFA